MTSRPRRPDRDTGQPRQAWVPPGEYTTGPHRWAIVPLWQGATVHTWICTECDARPTTREELRGDCPGWRNRTVPL